MERKVLSKMAFPSKTDMKLNFDGYLGACWAHSRRKGHSGSKKQNVLDLEGLKNRMLRNCQVFLYRQRTGTCKNAAGGEIRKGSGDKITKGIGSHLKVLMG